MLRNTGGGGGYKLFWENYNGVWFNVISFTRGGQSGPISRKKRYITLEWPLNY